MSRVYSVLSVLFVAMLNLVVMSVFSVDVIFFIFLFSSPVFIKAGSKPSKQIPNDVIHSKNNRSEIHKSKE